MRILFIHTSDYIYHPVTSRHYHMMEEISKRHEVYVAHFRISKGKARETNTNLIDVTMFSCEHPLAHYTLNAPYHYYKFDRIIKDKKIDLVVVANILASSAAIRAAKKYKIPVIFDLSDWLPDSAAAYIKNPILQELVRNSVWLITKQNLSDSNKIITVSQTLVDRLKDYGFESDLITNGVDTKCFKPLNGEEWRHKFGIYHGDFVIGFVGSVEKWYDIKSMIEAMPELLRNHLNTRLLVVGKSLFTEYKKELKQLSIDLGVSSRVSFVGAKPYEVLSEWISCMDICVIPLLPEDWGSIALPNKYFEYAACRKPILMRPMGNVERIGGKDLMIYHNNEEYINHILKFIDNPYIPDTLHEDHSWVEKTKQFEKICIEVIEENK